MAETAIVVSVAGVSPAVDLAQRAHTRAGRDGLGPHVTLLYPFADSSAVDVARVREVVARVAAFEFRLVALRVFEQEPRVLYLAPEPERPFRELTAALAEAFPEHPPYGGAHPHPIPHATVAVADDATLAEVEAELVPALPLTARADEAILVARGDDGRWRLRDRLPLR